tara:strand:+ start:57 stop:518 length:462 start_codon:yes stop_codon:yes gene_type:complete
MKQFFKILFGIAVISSFLVAGDVEEIKKQIMDNNEYSNKNNRSINEYSKNGALEYWSSGGLIQEIDPDGRPEEYDYFNIKVKHIEVVVLVSKKAAVAMYYSEGSMKPKNSPAVNHYLTRVTQAYVKENGKWKIRASHWSPIQGGSGTSQTSTE